MKKVSIAPALLIVSTFWLISAAPLFALSVLPGPSHDWTLGSGRYATGLVETIDHRGTVTIVRIAGYDLGSIHQKIEVVAIILLGGLLTVGIGSCAAIGSLRNRREPTVPQG